MAGLVPVQALDRLLVAGDVSPDQYLDLLAAQGWTQQQAYGALQAVHSMAGLTHVELPPPPVLPVWSSPDHQPGRRAARYKQPQPTLRPHPIDQAIRAAEEEDVT